MRVAVVLAGGSGRRSGTDTNKVLVELGGVAVIRRSVEAMIVGGADHVVVVCRPADRVAVAAALEGVDHLVTDSGSTRQQSEAAGIAAAADLGAVTSADVIAVHDAARPLVSPGLVAEVFDAAASGAAYPAIERHDLWHRDQEGRPRSPVEGVVLAAQTPQAVRADVLIGAVRNGGDAAADAPDTIDVVQRFGPASPTVVVRGEATNIKLTWPEDFTTAERLLEASTTDDARSDRAGPVESVSVSLTPPVEGVAPDVTDETGSDDYAALGRVEIQIGDAKTALDCLAVEGTAICETCRAAESDGTLADRPALARCVAAKRG